MKASELIAALESGKILATGDPKHIEVVRREMSGPNSWYFYSYGWGSAYGTIGDRLESIINRPWLWVTCDDGKNAREIDAIAEKAMLQAGRWIEDPESRFGADIWQWNDAPAKS